MACQVLLVQPTANHAGVSRLALDQTSGPKTLKVHLLCARSVFDNLQQPRTQVRAFPQQPRYTPEMIGEGACHFTRDPNEILQPQIASCHDVKRKARQIRMTTKKIKKLFDIAI